MKASEQTFGVGHHGKNADRTGAHPFANLIQVMQDHGFRKRVEYLLRPCHPVGTPGRRDRLLSHLRRRLQERFGLSLSNTEISGLDRQHRLTPITHRTATKLLKISRDSVYAVLTSDHAGDLTLTTANTAVMLDQIGGF